ncbi:hypothetical protein [Granulicella sp. dw_53]|uniref:hypothetical protein n=1 Tax=Granulicella sp. dw_53 TaxID=2719792 RepID=UPI001BD42327|nr:hypothetical protein [Granulicella sp. dw_53]
MRTMMTKVLAGVVVLGMTGFPVYGQLIAAETPASPSQNAEHTAQQRSAAAQEAKSINAPSDGSERSWTPDQLVTSTVHEAWVLSGRNEDQFFEMVKELSALSAQKRGLTLPESEEAGVKAGNWIKKEAKKDPDQLLYSVVDKAVMKVGIKASAPASTK